MRDNTDLKFDLILQVGDTLRLVGWVEPAL
jgi:hypothetical protein